MPLPINMDKKSETNKEYAISWKVNLYWTVEYEDHGDGTCTILSHYQDRRWSGIKGGYRYVMWEKDGRMVDTLDIYEPGTMNHDRGDHVKTLDIRNKDHVFSFNRDPVVKI